ncbi:MAG TPA: radical SAM protein [Chloroflexia bacterium]|nr:radical SAM protein [Chloroflexia bacterium]
MKVLLVQLPVPDNRHSNLPLALGYLKAMADAAAIPGLSVELLEPSIQNRGGDALITEAILRHDPDIVGFSLYTWNSSRTLGLARALKQRAPEILLLGGGPEVNYDGDFVLSSPDFDFLVQGEGERTFVELLRLLNKSGLKGAQERVAEAGIRGLGFRRKFGRVANLIELPLAGRAVHDWIFGAPQPALEDVNMVPSAYLSGALEEHLGRYISIELSRWCPSKCTFCYYGRQDLPRGGKRYFEVERIRQELLFAMERGVEQVHFVEANLNTLPHLEQIYSTIKETGANRKMSFYAELRGEAIDREEAQKLVECNFSVVEVGLQSAVPEVMARVRRKNHLPRLVQGVRNLRSLGTEVFLDVILGLPGETPETFHRTLDFVEQNDLQPYDLFHLQILSGTQLKAEVSAGQHGIHYQPAPPYFVLETAELSFEKLCELRLETLQRKGDPLDTVPGLPQAGPFDLADDLAATSEEGTQVGTVDFRPVERVVLDFDEQLNREELSRLARQLGSHVTLWLKPGQAGETVMTEAEEALNLLSEPNLSGVWQLFVETERPLTEAEQSRLLKAIRHEAGYPDRLGVFALGQSDPAAFSRWPSISFYQLLPYHPENAEWATPEVVWQVTLANNSSLWPDQLAEVVSRQGAGVQIKTPSGTQPAKLKAALAGIDPGSKTLWLADSKLAAGMAFAFAEDSTEALTNLDYPLTARLSGGRITVAQPARKSLELAALRWAV